MYWGKGKKNREKEYRIMIKRIQVNILDQRKVYQNEDHPILKEVYQIRLVMLIIA